MQAKTVTVISGNANLLRSTVASLEKAGYAVNGFQDGDEALLQMERQPPRAIVADMSASALQQSALPTFLREHEEVVLVALTHIPDLQELGDKERRNEAGSEFFANLRAYDCIPKTVGESGLVRSVNRAIEHRELIDEIRQLRAELEFRANGPSQTFEIPVLPDTGISLQEIERELLTRALEKFRGNQTRTARYLNISRRTLIYRIGKYNLKNQPESRAAAS